MHVRNFIICSVCMFSLSVSAAAQEKKAGELVDCTTPGVLTADGVKIDPPVRLVQASLFRDGSIYAKFVGASDRTLCLHVGGLLFYSDPFLIVNKNRVAESGIGVESKSLPINSKESQAVTKFLQDWYAKDVPEEKRSRIEGIMKLPREANDKEFNGLSEEDQNLYRIVWFINDLGKEAK
ncbi:MAG: hypothetical protein H7Z38_16420, partial [Rubrivivax sp.]|nr:hypothetical protein [Pyrinomonadaceae bacterium]